MIVINPPPPLILLACVAFVFSEGVWSNALRFITVVAAALLATNYFEPVANQLDAWLPSYTYCWDFLALWGLFCIFIVLFRALTDQLSKVKVRFPKWIDQAGGLVFSALVGWVMVCFMLTTLHTAPLGRSFSSGRSRRASRCFWASFSPDKQWLSFMQQTSKGALCRSVAAAGQEPQAAVFDPEQEFQVRYNVRRKGVDVQVMKFSTVRLGEGQKPVVYESPPPDAPPEKTRRAADKAAAPNAMSEPHASPPRLFDTLDADMVRVSGPERSGRGRAGVGDRLRPGPLGPMFWILPVLGVAVSGLALWRIRRPRRNADGPPPGTMRAAALDRLRAWSTAVDGFVYRRLFRQEARQFAAMWFDYLLVPKAAAAAKIPRVDAASRVSPAIGRSPLGLLPAQCAPARMSWRRTSTRRWCGRCWHWDRRPRSVTTAARTRTSVARVRPSTWSTRSARRPEGKTTFFVDLELNRIKVEGGRASWQLSHAEVANPQDR